jgi:hypothetical protein
MTKKQRDDFENAMSTIKANAQQDCGRSAEPPDAWAVEQALRAIWSRLDDIEVMAKRAVMHTKGC